MDRKDTQAPSKSSGAAPATANSRRRRGRAKIKTIPRRQGHLRMLDSAVAQQEKPDAPTEFLREHAATLFGIWRPLNDHQACCEV